MPVVDRQHHGGDPHAVERGIVDVVTEKGTKLFENETLHTQVPVAGTLFFTSHDTRLQGGHEPPHKDITLRSAA